jgi:hypothetical protein
MLIGLQVRRFIWSEPGFMGSKDWQYKTIGASLRFPFGCGLVVVVFGLPFYYPLGNEKEIKRKSE